MHIYGNNVTLESSWLHDNAALRRRPLAQRRHGHDDNIQIEKGTNLKFVGNRIDGAYNAAMMFTQGSGIVSNVTVDKNCSSAAACTINIAESGKGAIQGLSFTNNTFARTSRKAPLRRDLAGHHRETHVRTNLYTDGMTATVRKGN